MDKNSPFRIFMKCPLGEMQIYPAEYFVGANISCFYKEVLDAI